LRAAQYDMIAPNRSSISMPQLANTWRGQEIYP
jgi:hypothetical protein